MNTKFEELYLEAENDIKNNNYASAFSKYESILYEEPYNGPTLNSLGWLYKTQVEDFEKAETFYLASIKGAPNYPHAYINYATLLSDMERFDEMAILLEKSLKVPTVEKAAVYLRFGMMEELKLNFAEAITYYEKAILMTLSEEKIKDFQINIDRCRTKMELSGEHGEWIGKLKIKK